MTLTEMRELLLETLEIEEEDWPQPLMDAAIAEAYDRVLAEDKRWPWLEHRWDVQVQAGSNAIPLADSSEPISEVVVVRLNGDKLIATDEDTAYTEYGDTVGIPRAWSRWSQEVNLWPATSTDITVQVQGYRSPRPFQSLGGWEPDLPPEMHWLVLDWALANEFQRQEDTEMMVAYRQKFDLQMRKVKERVKTPPAALPLVVGGDGSRIRNR